MVVRQHRSDVEEVTKATEEKGPAETNTIGNGTGSETDDGKGTVESGVSDVDGMVVLLATSTQTVQGIEHTRAEEADEGDEEQLRRRGGIVWKGERSDLRTLVHPWLSCDFRGGLDDFLIDRFLAVRIQVFLTVRRHGGGGN